MGRYLFFDALADHASGHAAGGTNPENCENGVGFCGNPGFLQSGQNKKKQKIQKTAQQSPEKATGFHGLSG